MGKVKRTESSQKIEQLQKPGHPVSPKQIGTLTGKQGNRGVVIKKLEEFKNRIEKQASGTIKKINEDFNEKVREFNQKILQLQDSINKSIGEEVKEKFGKPIETGLEMIQTRFEKEIKSITDLIRDIDRVLNEDVQTFNRKIEEFKKETNEMQKMFREMIEGSSKKDDNDSTEDKKK